MWKYYALLSAFFAALTAIFAKVGLRGINSDLATAIRTVVILAISVGIVAAGNHFSELKTISRNAWIFLVLSGAATGLSWLFYFKALQIGDASRVASLDKISIVFTLVLAFVFLKEPVSPRVVIGGTLIFCGCLFMLAK